MKKILLALDALHADKNTITFACYLGGLTKSAITGIFLENLVVEQKPVLKHMHGMTYVNWEIDAQQYPGHCHYYFFTGISIHFECNG